MQAITTKYFGPTNFRGGRIKASAQRGSVTVAYNHALNIEGNHRAAIDALVVKFVNEDAKKYGTDVTLNPWNRPYVVGAMITGFAAVYLP